MQVQTTNTVDYTTATKDTTKTNKAEKTSDVKFDMSKPFDIDSFTFEDYKAIDGKDLKDWIKNSNLPNEKEILQISGALFNLTTFTNDDTFNKVLFDKVNKSDKTGESLFRTVIVPLADMRDGGMVLKGEHLDLMNPAVAEAFKNDPKNWSTSLSGGGERTRAYTFEVKDMLSLMKNFREFYNNLDSESKNLMGDISGTNQALDEIVAEYTKRKDEQKATLDAYTRNTKPNPILP